MASKIELYIVKKTFLTLPPIILLLVIIFEVWPSSVFQSPNALFDYSFPALFIGASIVFSSLLGPILIRLLFQHSATEAIEINALAKWSTKESQSPFLQLGKTGYLATLLVSFVATQTLLLYYLNSSRHYYILQIITTVAFMLASQKIAGRISLTSIRINQDGRWESDSNQNNVSSDRIIFKYIPLSRSLVALQICLPSNSRTQVWYMAISNKEFREWCSLLHAPRPDRLG